jgi:hypothetical protein
LADFLAIKDLADFLHEVLLDFLAYGFAHSVNNILLYKKLANTEGGKLPGGRAEYPVWAGY